MNTRLEKIISGGQTGVDRAALDAALDSGFPCGGWCPENRKAEDGRIPDRYPLQVLRGAGYAERTRRNVLEAEGTAILHFGRLEGGTAATAAICEREGRPCRLIDGDKVSAERAAALLRRFIAETPIRILNVAGPRASVNPQAYPYAYAVVMGLLRLDGP